MPGFLFLYFLIVTLNLFQDLNCTKDAQLVLASR